MKKAGKNQGLIRTKVRVRIMAHIEINDKIDFETARRVLADGGIILYNKKHRKGGYVCRASKKLREQLERMDE